MNIESREKVEDCFDGSSVFCYSFNRPWDRDAIMKLNELGEVDYFPDFPRPFFRLRSDNGLQVKGVEGDCQCRAIFPSEKREVIIQVFEDFFTAANET